jgi:hypothetical protein
VSLIPFARVLIIIGVIFVIIGSLLYLMAKVGFAFSNLPGDIHFERENFSCILALGTSILLSILLTVVLNLFARFLNR